MSLNGSQIFSKAKDKGKDIRNPLKIAILGFEQAGKSAITTKLVTGFFLPEYDSENIYLVKHMLKTGDDQERFVDIIDAPSEQIKSDTQLRNEIFAWADAFIFVYDQFYKTTNLTLKSENYSKLDKAVNFRVNVLSVFKHFLAFR